MLRPFGANFELLFLQLSQAFGSRARPRARLRLKNSDCSWIAIELCVRARRESGCRYRNGASAPEAWDPDGAASLPIFTRCCRTNSRAKAGFAF